MFHSVTKTCLISWIIGVVYPQIKDWIRPLLQIKLLFRMPCMTTIRGEEQTKGDQLMGKYPFILGG